ncbi:MAG: YceI family protein [Candidatus Nanopelagicales bacterium]
MTAQSIETAVPATATGAYDIDPSHSNLGFVARHAMVTKVRGNFSDISGSLTLDVANPAASSAEVTVEVASVDTRNAQRDEHLRTNDFFDAAQFPQLTFKSTAVTQTGATSFDVTGDLTIRGVTKPVTVSWDYTGSATDPFGNERVGFEGSATINRADFGLKYNAPLAAGGVLISEKIVLELEVSAIKREAK